MALLADVAGPMATVEVDLISHPSEYKILTHP